MFLSKPSSFGVPAGIKTRIKTSIKAVDLAIENTLLLAHYIAYAVKSWKNKKAATKAASVFISFLNLVEIVVHVSI
ncbi:hypothetical protein CVD28_10120 [Bacillus sp. M6-12]|nr:hypothetical protein CVD28_10120 [Bacillus sp. M6-12]